MKKVICMLLCAVLLLGLCACGGEEKKGGLQVGYASVDATPLDSVNISGGDSKNRISEGVRDPIMITCVALSTGGDTYLVYTMDVITTEDGFGIPTEAAISEATGIPAERILLNSTHTHSGPAIEYEYDLIVPYREKFYKAAVRAAERAIADMSPATVSSGAVETEGLIFVRHYEMSDGTYAGANYGSFETTIVGHAYEGDEQVQVVRFTREAEDKQDVILIANPAHATAVSGTDKLMLSADIAYSTRDYVAKNSDCLVAYFIGAAGDQVPSSRIPEEGSTEDYLEYGKRMGKYIVDLLPQLQPVEAGDLVVKTQSYTGKTNKEGLDRLSDAQQAAAIIREFGNSAPESKAAAKQFGFSSVYQATAIVNRSKRPETQTMSLDVMALGDLAFVFAPYEMFSENGKYIKENSPFGTTVIITCGESHQGYMPSVNGFKVECYETHVTVYAPGTAETLADVYIDMLKSLKGE